MAKVKLSLGQKTRQTNVEMNPSLAKKGCKPRKKLTGFALVKKLRENAVIANDLSSCSLDKNEDIPTCPTDDVPRPAVSPPVRKCRISKPPTTTQRTCSNPIRRSNKRKTTAVSILDLSPPVDRNSLYTKRVKTFKDTIAKKEMSVHASSMVNKLIKHSDCYRFLYHRKVSDDFDRQKNRVDSSIVLANQDFPRTTTNDIKTLILNCNKNIVQSVSRDLLFSLGIDISAKCHDLKIEKLFAAFVPSCHSTSPLNHQKNVRTC